MNMLEHISRQEKVLEQVQADLQAFHKLEQKRNKKVLKKLLTYCRLSCNIVFEVRRCRNERKIIQIWTCRIWMCILVIIQNDLRLKKCRCKTCTNF